MTREEAIEHAKKVAAKHSEHDYLKAADTDPEWMPHEWVIEALMTATEKK